MDRFNEEIDLMLFESLEKDGILLEAPESTALTTTSSDEESKPPKEPSPAEMAAKRGVIEAATEILAIRVMADRETVSKIQKAGQILRKYFIKKRIRAEQLTEDPLLAEAAESSTNLNDKAARATRAAGASSDSENKNLLKYLTKEVEVSLQDMEKSLKLLQTTVTPEMQEQHEQRMQDADYEDRFKGVILFMNRFAGKGLNEIRVNLNELKKHKLDESFLRMFGAWIKYILNSMFGDFDIPVSVTGNPREVEAFGRAVAGEKRYIDSAKRYGLNHATTYKNKAVLDTATKSFERETGLKWPFK
jgi:hypothetical protein